MPKQLDGFYKEDMTNLESHEAFERFIIGGLTELDLKHGKEMQN